MRRVERRRRSQRACRAAAVLLVALPAGLAPAVVGASELITSRRLIPASTWAFTGEVLSMLQQNPCLSDDLAATRLSRFPEGLALIRMRADLDAAERLESVRLARESRVADGQLDRLRRLLDSMVRDVERVNLERVNVQRTRTVTRAETERVALANEQRAINARVRLLANEVDSVVQITLRRAEAMADAAPTGYLGVTLSSVPVRQALRSGYVVSYCEYPLVETVDPGSPAERGGLRAGDTLVAFNGRDVLARVVDYTALLVPGRTVRLSVRRAGRRMELPLRVDARPDLVSYRIAARWDRSDGDVARELAEARLEFERARATAFPLAGVGAWPTRSNVVVLGASGGAWRTDSLLGFLVQRDSTRALVERAVPRAPRRGAVVAGVQSRSVPALEPAVPSAPSFEPAVPAVPSVPSVPSPTPPMAPAMVRFFAPSANVVLAGAKLQTLGEELRSSLALPEGVLVLEVLRGTPAFDSGLRAGDVIQRADARTVRRVEDVRAALGGALERRRVSLQVVDAKGAARSVQLRW